MSKFRFLAIVAAALMLGSCSDEQIQGGGDDNPTIPVGKEGVYFALQIDLPSAGRPGSRSETTTGPNDDYVTSSGGVEIGQDYENNVGDVIIVLARSSKDPNKNNAFIAAATVPKKEITPLATDFSSYQVLSSFSKTQLDAFYNSLGQNTTADDFLANIYVFANPTSGIRAVIFGNEDDDTANGAELGDNSWVNDIRTIPTPAQNSNPIVNSIAKSDAFLMSNGVIATRGIPTKLSDWNYYTTSGNPFNLSGNNSDVYIDNSEYSENGKRGAVKLERAAARFDFRDGSPLRSENKPFTYHVLYSGSSESDAANRQPIVDIELINMSLVNVNTKFYPLRRVSDNGEPNSPAAPNNVTVCGVERAFLHDASGGYITGSGNYVVDANYAWKHSVADAFNGSATPGEINYSGNFFYPFFDNAGNITADQRTKWYTSLCKDVLKLTEDNSENWTHGPDVVDPGDYHIWTYASENTIAHVEDQINGISTGVVFKGIMRATDWALNDADEDTKQLAKAITNPNSVTDPETKQPAVIYQFGGDLYLTWTKLRNAAIAAAMPDIHWVAPDPTKPDDGHWVFSIDETNRANSLYVAVFGTGGVGSVTFTYTEYEINADGSPKLDADGNKIPVVGTDGKPVTHTGTIQDNLPVDVLSSNYLYQAWVTTPTRDNEIKYKEAMTSAKISIYQPYNDTALGQGGNGYYVYYYYWNRHNDNGNNGVMGPMEFAVVRNNVYKLAVTAINKLGHPRLTENDPEKPTGGTPDEKEDVYITVTAQVLPWVVRVNNITF